MTKLAKSKLAASSSDAINPTTSKNRNGNVNKDLPLAPDEIAGLREQHRQYTKDLEAEAESRDKKPSIDPNHAYPNFAQSTTLLLSEIVLYCCWCAFAGGLEPRLDIKCGPLLRYVWTDYNARKGPLALYTILLVTNDAESSYTPAPVLEVAGINTAKDAAATRLNPEILHQERGVTFWRWKIYLNLIADERRLAYRINGSNNDLGFWVPGANKPMRIVFYSCNGITPPPDCL